MLVFIFQMKNYYYGWQNEQSLQSLYHYSFILFSSSIVLLEQIRGKL